MQSATGSPHRPRKRFGQHFLRDPRVIERIVVVIRPEPGQRLVEIGPGLGAITAPLLERAGALDVIELDRDVIPLLEQRCKDLGALKVHALDVLRFNFHDLAAPPAKLRVVGNLPYNISTPLLFHLLDYLDVIADMHFMVQKEVAERICAKPGDDDYSRLSVMVQYRCTAERLFNVGPSAFSPPPKVESAVIRLTPLTPVPWEPHDNDLFKRTVAASFSHRRKMLRSALKGIFSADQIAAAGIDPEERAENLSVRDFVALAK
jgi:16S rRNA (adenine1518-N6/adenine1519-N6)-dimethyltransferase